MAKALKKKLKLKLICFNPFIKIPSDLVVKNLPANAGDAGDVGSIPGLGRSPGERNVNPLKYSCLEKPRTEEPGGLKSMGSQTVRHD